MMITLSKALKPKTFFYKAIKWKCSRCLVHHFAHISSKVILTHLVSLNTLGSPLEFEIKCCGTEKCLAAQHDFVIADPLAGQWGL